MLLKCSECSETWNKAIKFFHHYDLPPTLDILPWCWPRPHVLTFVKISKNTQMNFPYHTESISQHVHHFKPIVNNIFFGKKLTIFREGGVGGTPFAENSAKIIHLIFEPFPYHLLVDMRYFLHNAHYLKRSKCFATWIKNLLHRNCFLFLIVFSCKTSLIYCNQTDCLTHCSDHQ